MLRVASIVAILFQAALTCAADDGNINIQRVYADKVLDRSKVAYFVRSDDGKIVSINFVYENIRPDPDIVSVAMVPPENVDKSGTVRYTVRSEEGKTLEILFKYGGSKIREVSVYTPVPDKTKKAAQSEALNIMSHGGYLLEFQFEWDIAGKQIKCAISPEINPFKDALPVKNKEGGKT